MQQLKAFQWSSYEASWQFKALNTQQLKAFKWNSHEAFHRITYARTHSIGIRPKAFHWNTHESALVLRKACWFSDKASWQYSGKLLENCLLFQISFMVLDGPWRYSVRLQTFVRERRAAEGCPRCITEYSSHVGSGRSKADRFVYLRFHDPWLLPTLCNEGWSHRLSLLCLHSNLRCIPFT